MIGWFVRGDIMSLLVRERPEETRKPGDYLCLNCREIGAAPKVSCPEQWLRATINYALVNLDKHGRCEVCGSDAVVLAESHMVRVTPASDSLQVNLVGKAQA